MKIENFDQSPAYFQEIHQVIFTTLVIFDRFIKLYVRLNFLFFLAISLEFIFTLYFFSYLTQSFILAFHLGVIFLTIFGYFIFRLYFNTIKPEKFQLIKEEFAKKCKILIGYQANVAEHCLSLASAFTQFSECMTAREYSYYSFSHPIQQWLHQHLNFIPLFIESFSYWCHEKDLIEMRELLLSTAIEEHIKLIRFEPTSLEIHAALANAYVMLSTLYGSLIKKKPLSLETWFSSTTYLKQIEKKFYKISQKAIEEFKIISEYAPHDPWVHLQLAYSYHDLNMPIEEIKQYETILRLNPSDKEALFKLGSLYFQEGMNAKGLWIYEVLKNQHPKKAASLITLYGC